MAKSLERKNLKPAGKCIFCEGGAVPGNPMTQEHLWSTWMSDNGLLPPGSEHSEIKEVKAALSRLTAVRIEKQRQGGAYTKKIKVVCKNCNSGWMSRLETAAQSHLTPLIKGENYTLTTDAKRTVAEWVFLKMLVIEHNGFGSQPTDPVFDQRIRNTFMTSKTIPTGVSVLLGSQNGGPKWCAGFMRHATGLDVTATFPPPPVDQTRPKNVATVTWGIGRLLIFFSAVLTPKVEEWFSWNPEWPLFQIWPKCGETFTWPPRLILHDDAIERLAWSLEAFMTSGAVIMVGGSPVNRETPT